MQTNGKSPSLEEMRERKAILQEAMELQALEHKFNALESLHASFAGGWGSFVNPYEYLPDMEFGGQYNNYFFSRVDSRAHGRDAPLYRNEMELGQIRHQSRNLCRTNNAAKGLLRNLVNYVVGKGYPCNVVPLPRFQDVDSEKPGAQIPERVQQVADAVQQWIDDFFARNKFRLKQREIYRRIKRDGECFLRLFCNEETGKTTLRWVEPEQIINPPGGTEANGWSFGIRHQVEPVEDVETVIAYYVAYKEDAANGVVVEAKDMLHIKNFDEDSTVKRGLPEFSFETYESLRRAGVLQRNMSITAASQAAVAEITQFENASKSQVEEFNRSQQALTAQNPYNGRTEQIDVERPGQKRQIPKGQSYVEPPFSQSIPLHLQVEQADLRTAAAAVSAPEYFTGNSDGSNFAAIRETSAPFLKNADSEQDYLSEALKQLLTDVIRRGIEYGKLPQDTFHLVELQIEPAVIVQRDPLQRTQELTTQVQARLTSPQTAMLELGRDPDKEKANWQEWDESNGGDMAGLADLFGGVPGGDGGQGKGSQWGGDSMPFTESRKRKRGSKKPVLESDFDENKHKRADDGKFTSGGGGSSGSKANKKPSKISKDDLDFIKDYSVGSLDTFAEDTRDAFENTDMLDDFENLQELEDHLDWVKSGLWTIGRDNDDIESVLEIADDYGIDRNDIEKLFADAEKPIVANIEKLKSMIKEGVKPIPWGPNHPEYFELPAKPKLPNGVPNPPNENEYLTEEAFDHDFDKWLDSLPDGFSYEDYQKQIEQYESNLSYWDEKKEDAKLFVDDDENIKKFWAIKDALVDSLDQAANGLPRKIINTIKSGLSSKATESRRILESGFTGTKTDSLGRKVKYVDGKRVAGDGGDTTAATKPRMPMKAKAWKAAQNIIAIANASPAFAKETMLKAGFSPKVATAAYIVATVGDYAVPGLPAASAVITIMATIRKPAAPLQVVRELIAKFKSKKATESVDRDLMLAAGELLHNAANYEWAMTVLAVAIEDERQLTQAAIDTTVAILEEQPEPVDQVTESRKYSSTQFDLPNEISETVLDFAKSIPPKDLASDGIETEPHITVKYGLHTDNPDDVKSVVLDFGPVFAKLGKVSIFPASKATAQLGEQYDVLKIDVDSEDLHSLNKVISDKLEHTDTHLDYKPHVTIAYLKPGRAKKYIGKSFANVGTITFNEMVFSGKNRDVTKIGLDESVYQVTEADLVDDTEERADAIADLLLAIYGDDALALLDEDKNEANAEGQVTESWNPDSHPRGKNGRFIKKNSAEAVAATKDAIKNALAKPKSQDGLAELMNNLNLLTVAQIREVSKDYQIKGSGKSKDALVAKIAKRLDVGRREPTQKSNFSVDSPKSGVTINTGNTKQDSERVEKMSPQESVSAKFSLPKMAELQGTEKQVEFAEQVRTKLLNQIIKKLEHIESTVLSAKSAGNEKVASRYEATQKNIAKWMYAISQVQSAKRILDVKDQTFTDIGENVEDIMAKKLGMSVEQVRNAANAY